MPGFKPAVIGIGGFTSNTGKTTLVCDLLRLFPGWEAIKTTRGHYRSCGKDPHTCCVSHLLSDRASVRSGYDETYAPDKDTGRYWEAGAANVHWVIATEEQVGEGINEALKRVSATGVLVEGNSFSEFVDVDMMLMVGRAANIDIKKTARRALGKAAAFYLTGEVTPEATSDEREEFEGWLHSSPIFGSSRALPVYTRTDLPQLATQIARALGKTFVAGSSS